MLLCHMQAKRWSLAPLPTDPVTDDIAPIGTTAASSGNYLGEWVDQNHLLNDMLELER